MSDTTGVPKRFEDKRLGDLTPGRLADSIADYVAGWEGHAKTGLGLLIAGPPGRGKSLAAAVVLNEVRALGSNGYFTTFVAYVKRLQTLMELRDAWAKLGDQDAYDEWQGIRNILKDQRNKLPLVVVDDVGKEHTTTTRFAEDEFDFLLRRRFDKGLPSVITSNLAPERWAKTYNDSMGSFIYEAFVIIEVADRDDHRRPGVRALR